jgi:GNAT superfamily N-acetyltransferase
LITLADAKPGDEGPITDLLGELDLFYGDTQLGTSEERTTQSRAALFGTPPAVNALLAWDGPTLAGLASWSLLWPAEGLTMSLYLKELYVRDAYRRRGVGRLLMDGLRAIAVARDCSRVEWTTDTGNPGAQAFYEALGAKPLGSKIFYRMAGRLSLALVCQRD